MPSASPLLPLIAFALGNGLDQHLMHLALSFGLIGLFLVSIVDSSFVPLPIPGITDIMLVLYAAQHANLWLLLAVGTIGSALGGWLSYQVGQSGGMAFIEKRTPKRIFKRVTRWMESHAVLAVAVPALLPPPMPLSPFVLAAGALHMSLRKFMLAFTGSRLVRHAIAIWLGVRFGDQVLVLWTRFSAEYGAPILIGIWVLILVFVGIGAWQIAKTSRSLNTARRQPAVTR